MIVFISFDNKNNTSSEVKCYVSTTFMKTVCSSFLITFAFYVLLCCGYSYRLAYFCR